MLPLTEWRINSISQSKSYLRGVNQIIIIIIIIIITIEL